MSFIIKMVDSDGVEGIIGSALYGVCNTAAESAEKNIDIPVIDTLIKGMSIHVKFRYPNTALNPTINVNGLGAKPLTKYGTTRPGQTAESSWPAGAVLTLTYDGDVFIMNDYSESSSDAASIFFGEYGVTTFADLKNAFLDGKLVIVKDPSTGACGLVSAVRKDTLTGDINGFGYSYTLSESTFSTIVRMDVASTDSWSKTTEQVVHRDSPAFTGTPTTTTPLSTANPLQIPTKGYVDDLINGLGRVLNFKGTKATESQLPSSGNVIGDIWLVTSDSAEYVWTGSSWEKFGPVIDLSGYATTEALNNGLALKVDKVTGKGLSTEDYTTAEKTKLANLDEIFLGEYGTTLFSDIVDAVTSGKYVLIKDSSNTAYGVMVNYTRSISTGEYGQFYFAYASASSSASTPSIRIITVNNQDEWARDSVSLAKLASPAFSGTPTTPNLTDSSGLTQIVNKAYADGRIITIDSTETAGATLFNKINDAYDTGRIIRIKHVESGDTFYLTLTNKIEETISSVDYIHFVFTGASGPVFESEARGTGSLPEKIYRMVISRAHSSVYSYSKSELITLDIQKKLSDASSSSSGLMSAADKTKLDGIETGAQVNTVTGVKGNSESSYRTGNVNITKANIGLGNVDDTADINKNVKTAKYRAPMVLGSNFDLNLLSDQSTYQSEVYNGVSALNCNFPVEVASHNFVITVTRSAFTSGTTEQLLMLAYDSTDSKYYLRTYSLSNSTWSSWHEIFTDSSSVLSILSYGHSTWNDFLSVYEKNRVVYCRASSNSDPSSGSQTRMAFLAYVNNAANPTEVEFQYYRSVSSHTASQQGDQVFVYKLTSANGGTWTVTTREASSKIIAGTGLGSSYSNGALTLTADVTGIRGSSESSYRTGNVTIAKADIGLGNVDNTSDVNKPVSTAQQAALNLKASLASPALTGTPTAPTPTSSSGNTQIANKEYVDNHIPDLSGYMQKGVDYVTAGQLSGTTLGSKATAEGDYATASGQYSHAEGNHTTASGIGSHAEGSYTEASASYAHAEGGNTTASDNYSHAEGEYTEASGEASHAEGGGYYNRHSTASGDYSHVEGSINVASGHSSHAEGQGNTASGNYSHAGGGVSEASASASFAHGLGLIADQENGFAFGKYNKTIAHAINAIVTVGNDASFNLAEQILAITLSNATIRMNVVNNNGYTYFVYKDHTGTITYPLYFEYDTYKKATDTYYNHYKSSNLIDDSGLSRHFSFGYANITSTSPTPETLKNVVVNENNVNYQVASVMDSAESGISILEMIGNGSDSSHRSNARTLDSNGNETLSGKLTLGAAPENDMDAATKKYVDDNSSDIQVRQSNSTENQNKRVLLSTAANDNTETGEVYKSGSLTYNPSLATLYCTKYSVANAAVISYDSTEQAIIFTF